MVTSAWLALVFLQFAAFGFRTAKALVEEKWQAVETMKSNIATCEDEVDRFSKKTLPLQSCAKECIV